MGKKKSTNLSIEEYQEKIDTVFSANNIILEKSELYHDFIISLLKLIDETYLGSDVTLTQDDMSNHFAWCFNKIVSNFEKERIFFIKTSKTTSLSYDYLWYFFYKGFYTSENEEKTEILLEYFDFLFDHRQMKTDAELDSFVDFYKMFDENLKKTN